MRFMSMYGTANPAIPHAAQTHPPVRSLPEVGVELRRPFKTSRGLDQEQIYLLLSTVGSLQGVRAT